MRRLELKNIKINDDYPLILSLNGKSIWKINENEQIEIANLLNRTEENYTITTISEIKIKPSIQIDLIIDVLNYFFGVCDEDCSPQIMWETDDCKYISLFKNYDISNKEEFNRVFERIIKQFPRLNEPVNFLETIPENEVFINMVSQIELAFPATWNVDFIVKDSF